jgi:hypothetical protein
VEEGPVEEGPVEEGPVEEGAITTKRRKHRKLKRFLLVKLN